VGPDVPSRDASARPGPATPDSGTGGKGRTARYRFGRRYSGFGGYPLSVNGTRRSIDPHWGRLWVGISLLVVTAIGLLAIMYVSLQIQSGVRAYVGGEGLYSKGQKDAVYHLIRYAETRDDAEYQAYLEAIAIPRGDKIARIELEKPDPDLDVATTGFAQGRNNAADIPNLITTFRVFRRVSYIDQAIAIWTDGDALIDRIVADGDQLHGLIEAGDPDPSAIDAIVADVGDVNAQLTVLEDRFSSVLGEGARWIRDLLFVVASVAVALLMAIAGTVFIWFVRRIRRSEGRYRTLLDAAPDAIVVTDRDGRVVLFNEAAERVVGSSSKAVIGQPVASVIDLETSRGSGVAAESGAVAPDAATSDGERRAQRRPVELQAQRADGRRFWAETTIADLGLGQEPGTTIIFRDVTERHAAEVALAESQERLAFALSAGRMGTWDWDMTTGVIRWSESLEEIVGLQPGSFGGTYETFVDLVHPEDRQTLREALERATTTDDEYVAECRMGPPGAQNVQIVTQGRVVRDEFGEPIRMAGVALDVTARRELESQLRHAQKMESVGRLAGGIAHDFNNLLTAITGHGDLLAQSLPPDDPGRADVAAINAAAARAATLTRQLLAYGRQSLLRPEPVDLNIVVSDIEPMLRRLIGEDVELRTELARDLGWVTADAGQLDQVILNLVVNARDAMPSGGTITLSTGNVELDEAAAAEREGLRPGPYVTVSVSDNGMGIDPATRGRIFEPYFTTKDRERGTGLGLATVLGIVEQSGGHIEVTSTVGQGTTFLIHLPRQAAPSPSVPVEPDGHRAPTGGRETVLLAEDEETVRRLTTMILERNGYRVLAAADGSSALDAAAEFDGSIDLLLTDVIMPGLNGRELADRFATLHPTARVLFMSGYAGEALSAQGVLDPSVAFLAKPFVPAELARKVREVLDEPTPA
jgi:two-component system cell cycle sensor histidine kinase/response regulator CckA